MANSKPYKTRVDTFVAAYIKAPLGKYLINSYVKHCSVGFWRALLKRVIVGAAIHYTQSLDTATRSALGL